MYAKLSSVECCVRYSSVTQACMGLYSLWEITFLPQPETGLGMRYSRPILATAEFFVLTALWQWRNGKRFTKA